MSFSEWKEYSLSELMEIIGGGTPKTQIQEYWDGDIPWLSVKDFNSDNRTVYETEKTITKVGLEKSSTKMLNKGDLIISARGTVGALAQLGKPMAFNQSCYGLRANKLTNNDFLYYLLKYKLKSIQQNTHGSVFDTITRETFSVLRASIPDEIKEQKNIAHILSILDDKIETNNQINKKLEEMAQAIFKQWFVDFEFPNEDGEPYKSSGGEMVESELGMIPKGWEIVQLNGLLEKIIDNRGKTPPTTENGVMLIETQNITMPNSFHSAVKNQKYVSKEIYDTWFRAGHPQHLDILCGTVGSGLPKWCFASSKGEYCIAQNLIALRVKKNVTSPYYLKLYMDTDNFTKTFLGRIVTTAQPSIKVGHLTSIKVISPKLNIIHKFNHLVSYIFKLIENNYYENYCLQEIRDNILPQLMSGELRVPIENYC